MTPRQEILAQRRREFDRWYLRPRTNDNLFWTDSEWKAWRKANETRCPVCDNDTLEKGEEVYIDLGHYQQVSPDRCEMCGYVQQGAQEDDPTPDPWFFIWCWEMQIDPWNRQVSSIPEKESNVKQWGYYVTDDDSSSTEFQQARLDELGKAGWELVQVLLLPGWKYPRYYLKRELPSRENKG